MNSTRINYNYLLIPSLQVNPYWLIGFIEGEGTFGFKNLSPYFQIGQHTKNLKVLQSIALYLESILQVFKFSKNSLPIKMSYALHTNNTISVTSNSNIDSLYDYLMFLLLDMPFKTRKGLDF